MFDSKKVFYFALGTLFGSVGLKILASKDAKKCYVKATAAGLRMKDYAMEQVTVAQENIGDILADAKALNEKRALEEENEVIENADGTEE